MNKAPCNKINAGPMFNAYPDSLGGTLSDILKFLQMDELKNVFQSFYILPSIFNTDLDRGFSVIDYELNEQLATAEDLEKLKNLNIELKLDFVLNHLSVLSHQFRDILKKGENSEYKDFFIDWNKFWEGCGRMTGEGYIMPEEDLIENMFFRKPGLPILFVRFPDGREVPYWNTFYQEVRYDKLDAIDLVYALDIQYPTAQKLTDRINAEISSGKKPKEIDFGEFSRYKDKVVDLLESRRKYLGQMDLNVRSPKVWEFYEETLGKLSRYGAKIVRLDAFAYVSKKPGLRNFFNEPETWELLEKIKEIADKYGLVLLPEIHSKYEEKIHEKLAEKGYLTYDFFLPGLIIDALERHTGEYLVKWFRELQEKEIRVVNMLGCHDGIPLLDLKGLLPDRYIDKLIDTLVKRGGYIKDLHGRKNMYYQVNCTYYSALGENDKKMLLARAIQIFMPGKPQVWYLDLFAGKNDYEAIKRGHKEINRTNLTWEQIYEGMKKKIVRQQLSLLRFRNTFPAFDFDSKITVDNTDEQILIINWVKDGNIANLVADLATYDFSIKAINNEGVNVFSFSSNDRD
ncbi:sucrose phosphorylase [Thermoclostridium stercorarium subsp. stercorarium DSM 8532]|jgi:sucrose phosphorylase|uniref:Sucrose phosphorylase n=3 Tax=Thermoclostridium stercorarium TaxID=1510 RepID=L7VUG6_THES1|nr:alpha-amylase family glycosyl hydrolase [Thermoclostridium stercorarium]AGC69218.1 sucrose phosphorylase [Thermoclostridium stercorarium subsp. stercorarium DSM 8532]AGI40188.1 maltooligosyl trehalose synthase [Thermoclostridium stercorarium subsp. stercorarium DSM 8532]ANW99492.1 glycosidase [Thermoclostridium stercorarium subsp. thermolacticum DSM 2910]ANX02118.1 glycosidase [Thermoclostridium stercorarium subsp. leptospartum DSM 9219]UZQ85186.1 alpha-amylase family glycosyl hydrolase [Th